MRNLCLLDSQRIKDSPELKGVHLLSIDYDTKDIYCASNNGLYVIQSDSKEVDFAFAISDYITKDTGCDSVENVVGLQHLPDQMSVCVAVSTGDILLWNITTRQCECVGSVGSGILSMGWSPDQEVVVIITGGDTMILMTRDFDVVTEVPIQQAGFGEAEFVTVGWGKKETQFHGSVGKQAAVQKAEPVKPVFDWDDRQPRISWRGDGQFFVVSVINSENGARVLRTWTREGTLHATSECIDGIEQALAWRPSGSLIATSQRKPNRHDIIFFEKNGLKHGEFSLPFGTSEVNVREVLWNVESTILLVWCEERKPEEKSSEGQFHPRSYLQLWTVGNYHWYLKQSMAFQPTEDDCVSGVIWDPEYANVLHVICGSGQYLQYNWCWRTHSDESVKSQVAVIDNNKLLMTPFSSMVVPPPMSAYSIKAPTTIQNVFYYSDMILVQLTDDRVFSYSFDAGCSTISISKDSVIQSEACGGTGFTSKCMLPVLDRQLSVEKEELSTYPMQFYHLTALDENRILCSSLTLMGGNSLVHFCCINKDNKLSFEKTLEVDGRIIAIARNKETNNVVIQYTDGGLYNLDVENMTVSLWKSQSGKIVHFSHPCSQITLCTLGGEEVVIGLTERYRLFVNNVEIATNCTSYALHDEFLLLTTHAHTCRCICRKTKLSDIQCLSDGKAHPYDEAVRRVERGSRIVCIVPNDTQIVLQMPRGNLETVHPRALVLAKVKHCLSELDYSTGFVLMRKHRINMNLLYDHNPELFLSNVQTFISQIDNATHINLFISELQEEDVTRTMYTATYQRDKVQTPGLEKQNESKINKVCDAMKDALIQTNYEKFLLCVLTTYVKKTTPELDVALQCIKNLKGKENDGNIRAEEALKYMLFLVDVNQLYDVALGTYDFDLVLMVAEKSQKDPKEYLPFLNKLRQLELNYQRYTIDNHLKKYRSALKNIVSCGKDHFEECLTLVKDQRLYPEALELYPYDTEQYQTIANVYGDYLAEKKYYEEAGLLYLKGKNPAFAFDSFDKCLDWRKCMFIASQLKYGKEKMSEISRRFASRLKEDRKHYEAAILLEQYAEDPEEAIVTLIQGHCWDEAIRIMYKYQREDFIETDLRPGLQEATDQQLNLLQEQRALFEKRCSRLAVVRQEKEKKKLELIEHGRDYNRPDADLYSDTSSATGDSVISDDVKSRGEQSRKSGSIYTKVSGSSRKSKRKAEKRKKWSLKEGSKNEDFAIIESLAQITKQIDSMRGDITSLIKALVQFNFEKLAREIQLEYEGLLKLISSSMSDIWDPMQQDTASMIPNFGPDSTANTIALAMQQGVHITSTEGQLDPVLCVPPSLNKDDSWKLNILARTTDSQIL